MQTWIYISLAANIVVLVPIVVLMAISSSLIDEVWGPSTAARGILMSIYMAILIASAVLVFLPVPAFIAALLAVQVVYKVTTPFTVGSFINPVVVSNLLISGLHIATLAAIYSEVGTRLFQTSPLM